MVQQTSNNNEEIADFPVNTKSDVYIDMMYQGKPIPLWLQEPVYDSESKDMQKTIPDWLQEPARLS